jgi:hypothetical protein
MGFPPSSKHSLDRINVNGNYEPSNCRWADRSTQQGNKQNSRLLTYRGRTMCVAHWARELKVSTALIAARADLGWSPEAILKTPRGWYQLMPHADRERYRLVTDEAERDRMRMAAIASSPDDFAKTLAEENMEESVA